MQILIQGVFKNADHCEYMKLVVPDASSLAPGPGEDISAGPLVAQLPNKIQNNISSLRSGCGLWVACTIILFGSVAGSEPQILNSLLRSSNI